MNQTLLSQVELHHKVLFGEWEDRYEWEKDQGSKGLGEKSLRTLNFFERAI